MSSPNPPLPESERLVVLERELAQLQKLCRRAELPPDEVQRALRPLVSAVNWSAGVCRARSLAREAGVWLLLCAALYLVVTAEAVRQAAHAYTRIALVKVLPYWDWTGLYKMSCLVDNPLYEDDDPELTEESCEPCESLDGLERLTNVSSAAIADNYLKLDRPVIVTDGTQGWPASRGDFDRHALVELFRDRRLADTKPCNMTTNLAARGKISVLLDKMSNPVIKKWFAHWENCQKAASKALRALYRRPYFLPAMVETTNSSWVLVSSNHTGTRYKKLPVDSDMMWMAQLKGTSGLRLTPRGPCKSLCPEIVDTLHTGEILVFTDFLWLLEYVPGYGTENVAIGVYGFWE